MTDLQSFTLMMASAQVVETSVNTNNSPSQDYTTNPDDHLNHNININQHVVGHLGAHHALGVEIGLAVLFGSSLRLEQSTNLNNSLHIWRSCEKVENLMRQIRFKGGLICSP